MAELLRIGFVGAGGIANAHADALSKVEGVQIVGVTDAVEESAQKLGTKTGATVYPDADTLAADGGLDAMFILTPPFARGKPEHVAIRHKIPFFAEKPLMLDTAVSDEITAEIERTGLITCTGYMNRYRKSIQFAKEHFEKEPAILGYGGWWGGTPGGGGHWWPDRSKSGGQFHEQATHTVDIARFFFGEVAEVYAAGAHGFVGEIPGYSMDDAVTVAMRFVDGGIANLMCSVSSNGGGDLFLNVHSMNRNFKFTGWEHSLVTTGKGEEPVSIPGEPDIFAIEDAAFIRAVREKDPAHIRSDYRDGAKSAAVSLAANKSIETGKAVSLV